MSDVININAKLFSLITKKEASRDNLAVYLPILLQRLNKQSGKKFCITLADGSLVWCDSEGKPTDPEKREYPSLLQQVKNLSGSLVNAAQRIGSVPLTAPTPEQQRLLNICSTCEKFDAEKNRCTLCGCKLPWKVVLAGEKCPHPDGNKWA